MKMMVLTGLATEQSFDNGGEARYFLVFNHGELRIPTSEDAAEEVVKAMFGPGGEPKEYEPDQPADSDDDPPVGNPAASGYDEDGVGQI